jgi:hypothetical protein
MQSIKTSGFSQPATSIFNLLQKSAGSYPEKPRKMVFKITCIGPDARITCWCE